MTEYIIPPNEARIERLYAFLSIDSQGRNGVLAAILPGMGSTPLVTGSRKTAHQLIPIAAKVAKETGVKAGLYAFARVEGEELWVSDE